MIKELEADRDKVERINEDLHRQADALRIEIRNKTEAIRQADNVLADNRKQIIALEADMNDLRRIHEKTKSDIANAQKSQQAEFQKNLETTSKISQLEEAIRYDLHQPYLNFQRKGR